MTDNSSAPAQVEEGNKLIAEFMGITYKPFGTQGMWSATCWYPTHLKSKGTWSCGNMTKKECLENVYRTLDQFHSSWDWLMPVVEKIGNISCDYYQENNQTAYEQCGKVMSTHICVSIQTVWQKVVDFIQWYNTQTPQP